MSRLSLVLTPACSNGVHLPHVLDNSIYLGFGAWKITRSTIKINQRATNRKVRLFGDIYHKGPIDLAITQACHPYTSLDSRFAINNAGNFNLNQRCRRDWRGLNGSLRARCRPYHMKMRRSAICSDYHWRCWRKSSPTRAHPSYSRSLVHQNVFAEYSAILVLPSCGNKHG